MDAALDSGARAKSDAGAPSAGLCVPGMSVACAGPHGCVGFQVCGADGTAFGGCDCGPEDASLLDAGEGGADGSRVLLQGSIQKGPFLLGSSVLLAAIDGTGASTGQVFSTTTSDNLGHFFLDLRYAGYIDMQAQGFYFNEVSGALSTAPIVLRALFDTRASAQDAHINIVTHLARNRALRLMTTAGKGLQDAEAQAEAELRTELALGGTGFHPQCTGVLLDELGDDDDKNAYLLAVGAVLLQAARDRAGNDPVDAQLQQLLDTVAADLANDGALTADTVAELHGAEQHLDVDLSMDLFQMRLQSIGSALAPANLDRAIDSDGDGYRNFIDTCPLVANADQSQVSADVVCSVLRHYAVVPDSAVPAANKGWDAVVLADFDGDGDDDLVVTDYARVSYYRSDSGRLAAPVTTPATVYVSLGVPSSVSAADANGDGKLDVVSYLGWAAGDGAGHFASAVPWPELVPDPDGGQLIIDAFALADFDGDGLPDVARVAEQYPSKPYLAIAMGTAKGAFAAPQKVGSLGVDLSVTWIAAAKMNADSFVDLVASTGNGVVVLLGDGHGSFVGSTPADIGNAQPCVADFDGDGKLDVAVGFNGSARVAFGDGNGSFGAPVDTSSTSSWVNDNLVPGDFDGDGKTDLAGILSTLDYTSFWPALMLSKGSTFGPQQALRNTDVVEVPPPVQSRAFAVYSGDLNGDGHADLVWLGYDARQQWSVQTYLMGVRR